MTIDLGTLTVGDLYGAMCRYLIANDWRRMEEVSGWWWHESFDEMTTGQAVEEQFQADGLDTRIMQPWEPYEFASDFTGEE